MLKSNYFKEMETRKENIEAFMRRQKSVETIALMGPTSSAKSTVVTELLPAASNMLLGKNVGDTAQTTLLPTLLMLNSRFNENEVLIQCITGSASDYTDFLENLKQVLTAQIYNSREELEEFSVNEDMLKQILNPTNCIFHVYQFSEEKQLSQSLKALLKTACDIIIGESGSLPNAANALFKKLRVKEPTIKKKDVYERLVDERLSQDDNCLDNLYQWYKDLKKSILDDLAPLWTFAKEYVLLDTLSDNSIATQLMEKLYSKDSACSLVFKEVRYATSPGEGFKLAHQKHCSDNPGRTVKINILDTVGLTQSSQDREVISENMDKILYRDSNALLFLCASDEQSSVYKTCISLFQEKKSELANKPITICRTKADITIRNIMINNWRRDTGTNAIFTDSEEYRKYITEAFQTFLLTQIEDCSSGENDFGKSTKGRRMEFLSLAPDLSSEMNRYLDNQLSSSRIFDILLSISEQIDNIYTSGSPRPWLQSTDLIHYPISVVYNGDSLAKTIALALTAKNSKNGNQYRQYITTTDTYHGRSVNTFRNKLKYGEGHETKATVYSNFKLYITNMVYKWLRDVIPMHDFINHLNISFNYLYNTEQADVVREEFPDKFKSLLIQYWDECLSHIARKLSYDCLSKDFEKSFYYESWSDGFRTSLKVIDQNFNSNEYWEGNIVTLLTDEANNLLQKMYIFD